jgi:tRNA-dihydrouridine synthase
MKGAGAGVLKDIDLMVRLTAAVVKSTSLPVTVKTRLGWDDNSRNIEEVAERLQDVGIKALATHGRTRTQMYKGSADGNDKVKNSTHYDSILETAISIVRESIGLQTGMEWMEL